jgi:CubicO group peptidase (beta-lactamase class C family)
MALRKSVIVLLIALVHLASCDDTSDFRGITGTVVDRQTNTPLSGVSVVILEDGPTTVSDENGMFEFTEADIAVLLQPEVDGVPTLALSITHPDYRPRETNVNLNESTEIKLLLADYEAYAYNAPVQVGDDIESGELGDVALNSQTIHNLMDKVYRDHYNELHSILIYRAGKLALEEYFIGNNDTIDFENGILVDRRPADIQWTRNEKHYVASVNKALTSTLVGIALDQSEIAVTAPIAANLPAYSSYFEDAGKAAITYEDCLTMQANLSWNEWGQPDLANMWKSEDFADFALSRNYLGAGAEWRYNSALPNILLKCVDDMVGGNIREWAHDNFYGKLGITDYTWQSQPDEYPEGSARMFIRPRDMLKIGITYLNNGVWKGEQVIPEQYVKECYEIQVNTPNTGDYSYYFWPRSINGIDYLSAEGDGGNYINIIPSLDMVVVVTQGLYLNGSYASQMTEIMTDYVLPAAE